MNITLRKANKSDTENIFQLATDPIVRENSFNKNEISFEHHKRWFEEKIYDQNTIYLVAEENGSFVGQIRFDIEKKSAILNISINKRYRNKGFGKIIIELAINYLMKNKIDLNKVIAKVINKNTGSRILFENCGFKLIKNDNFNSKYICKLK
jgi:RimJ/RimL family protein N-acetyltransferase